MKSVAPLMFRNTSFVFLGGGLSPRRYQEEKISVESTLIGCRRCDLLRRVIVYLMKDGKSRGVSPAAILDDSKSLANMGSSTPQQAVLAWHDFPPTKSGRQNGPACPTGSSK
jgi:hypothetical protein